MNTRKKLVKLFLKNQKISQKNYNLKKYLKPQIKMINEF